MTRSLERKSGLVAIGAIMLLLAPASQAEDSHPPAPATATAPSGAADSTQLICRRIEEIGSRLKANRVCMTKLQWADQRRRDRMLIEKSQMRHCKGNC